LLISGGQQALLVAANSDLFIKLDQRKDSQARDRKFGFLHPLAPQE
jgi:hypothetical protein